MRKQKPQFENHRFVVHRWQVEELLSMLGKHADAFELDEWLMTGAAQRADEEDAVIADWWIWLRQATLDEVRRRGMPIKADRRQIPDRRVMPGPVVTGLRCGHTPMCETFSACTTKTLNEARAEKGQPLL